MIKVARTLKTGGKIRASFRTVASAVRVAGGKHECWIFFQCDGRPPVQLGNPVEEMVQLPQVLELNMIVSTGGIRTERPLAKTVLARLIQIGEPTRSIYAERLRELKLNAREGLQLVSRWEGKRAELALTQPLSERERRNPKTLEEKAAALARQAMDTTVGLQKEKS